MKNLFYVLAIGVICFIISKYMFCICIIHGDSMNPTYLDKQIVLENKMSDDFKTNDVVVIKKNSKKLIKRVIGCPYDKLVIREGYIYVNDVKYNDLYIEDSGILKEEVILENNEYFVMGDNVNNSIDSRFSEIGIIKKDEIRGKVIR